MTVFFAVYRWGDAASTAAFRDEISVWETLRSQEEQRRHRLGRDGGEESTTPAEDRAAAPLFQANEGGVGLESSPTEFGQEGRDHRQQEEEEEALPGSELASPKRGAPLEFFDFILAGDVLYKHCLLAPFLGTVREMLVPGGRMLLCHVPRAGVTHKIVQEAFGEAGFRFEVLDGGGKAVGGGPGTGDDGDGGGAATAVRGVEMCEDDARRARLYELSRIATLTS